MRDDGRRGERAWQRLRREQRALRERQRRVLGGEQGPAVAVEAWDVGRDELVEAHELAAEWTQAECEAYEAREGWATERGAE